jgi:cytochrome c peroxidase
MRFSAWLLLPALAGIVLAACSKEETTPVQPSVETPVVVVPQGFPALPVPSDNQLTADRVALGKRLFYDRQLSRTREVACGSCHLQEAAFSDPRRVSVGIDGLTGTRNAPALVNLAYNTSFFWDGGVPTLEKQAIAPILNPVEMNMTMTEVVERLQGDPSYVDLFRKAYAGPPTAETVTRAIASFVRTLVSGNSRYDRIRRGELTFTDAERRGMTIFFGERGECTHCHTGFNFTDNSFRNNGLYAEYEDKGRFKVTERDEDVGKFKVPTLRNIALTAPYMHDGSLRTLRDVVDHYSSGGKGGPTADAVIIPLNLTDQEKSDLIAFLETLTDSTFVTDPRFRP